jgi:hypothetical protein
VRGASTLPDTELDAGCARSYKRASTCGFCCSSWRTSVETTCGWTLACECVRAPFRIRRSLVTGVCAPVGFHVQGLDQALSTRDGNAAVEFFADNTCRIEVVDASGQLQHVYFPKPVIANFVTDTTLDKVGTGRWGEIVLHRC